MRYDEQRLHLCASDEQESPVVQHLYFHDCLLPLPTLTNYVVVATPEGETQELPLAIIASRPGFDINNRRFAAVKISLGTPQREQPPPSSDRPLCEAALAEVLRQDPPGRVSTAAGVNEAACEATREAVALSARDAAAEDAAAAEQLRQPMATCLFFASGNMVCTGSANAYAAMHTVHMTAQRIREVVPSYATPTCKVENIVASVKLYPDLGATDTTGVRKKRRRKQVASPSPGSEGLQLDVIAREFGLRATYRPGLFPGAIFRPPRSDGGPVVCFLVFPSGQCVITGAKQTTDVFAQFKRFFVAFTWVVLRKQTATFVRASVKRAMERETFRCWEDAMEL